MSTHVDTGSQGDDSVVLSVPSMACLTTWNWAALSANPMSVVCCSQRAIMARKSFPRASFTSPLWESQVGHGEGVGQWICSLRTSPTTNSTGSSTSENGPKLFFPNLEVFVTDFLVHHYARPLDPMSHDKELTWCSSWWAHTEAVSRLSALWRAWETLRLDAGPGSCGPPAGTPRRSSRPPRTRPGRPGWRSHHD
jgi:hypothetical protein